MTNITGTKIGNPKLGLPGSPGVIKVGGDHHGGHGYKDAVIDGYPVKLGLRSTGKASYRVRKPVK
jgi:hypothetical protein